MIDWKIADRQGIEALQRLTVASSDLSPVMRAIGENLIEATKQRFQSSTGPDNQSWAKNQPATLERKSGSKPLINRGTLSEQISYALNGDTLAVGSNLEYAAMQQFGGTKAEFPHLWGNIPARPFLGLSSDDASRIVDLVGDYLNNAI